MNSKDGRPIQYAFFSKISLSLLFLFVFSIRLALLDQKNLWFDEVFSWSITQGSFYEIIVRTANDIHPPLYYFILKIWQFAAGDSIFSLRLLSAICTSLAVFYIYSIGRRYLTNQQMILALLLYAISPLNLYYSQEARMAGMNLLFNIAALYYFARLLEGDADSEIRVYMRTDFVLYVLFQTAALYTHYFSFFILIAEFIYLAYTFRSNLSRYRTFLKGYFVVFLLYSAWIPFLYEHFKRGQSWRQKQSFVQISNELVNFVKDSSLGLYYHYSDLDFIGVIAWFLGLFFAALMVLSFKKKPGVIAGNLINYQLLIGLALVAPLILAFLISFNQKVEFYRYLSILVPYICLCIVYLYGKLVTRYIGIAFIAIFAAINIFGISLHYKYDFKNDDYRQIVKALNENYSEGERIYVQPHFNGWIIDYMRIQENLKIPEFVDHRYGWNVLLDSIRTQNPAQFWLVMDYSAVDTSAYAGYISGLKSEYTVTFERNFPMAPARVELYRLKKEIREK